MKTMILALAALTLSSAAALADPAEGRWSTQPDDNGNTGIIEITLCTDGVRLCGTLIESHKGDGSVFESPNVGRRIVWDMEPEGDGAYSNGQVWAPDRDKTYSSHMTLSGNSLSVSGCVLRVFCRSQEWTRAQ